MTIDLLKDKGTPIDRQLFTWKELAQPTYGKLDDDAFTRVRVILMNGLEAGPTYADPLGRQLYTEIASIEEQHVTQYESIIDASETLLEKLLLMQAMEAYNYYSCTTYESNSRIKAIWERFLDYELGHVQFVAQLFEQFEKRDAEEVLNDKLPTPIVYESHRDYVRKVLRQEVNLIELARQNGKQEMAGSFERALAEEKEHLANVRSWVAAAQQREPVS
jgi:hypothetical protein